jgi:hypothetical protein
MAQVWMCEGFVVSPHHAPVDEKIQGVLEKFRSVFETPVRLPPYRTIDHQIPLLPSAQPVNIRPYKYSHFQKLELERIIEELLQTSVIRPSSSPFASPAPLV